MSVLSRNLVPGDVVLYPESYDVVTAVHHDGSAVVRVDVETHIYDRVVSQHWFAGVNSVQYVVR